MKTGFLDRTKTTFLNDKTIYIHFDCKGKQLMFDINPQQNETQYFETEQKIGLFSEYLTFRPFDELPRRKSFTWGEYELAKPESTFVKSGTKPKAKAPVYVEDGSIMVSSKQLEIEKPYYVTLENKTYVIFMPEEGVMDFYVL